MIQDLNNGLKEANISPNAQRRLQAALFLQKIRLCKQGSGFQFARPFPNFNFRFY